MRFLPVLLLIASTSCAESAASLDWPMMGRDASRNAVSPEKNPPTEFSLEPGKERNVAWSAKLGFYCFTPPVISDGLIWVGTDDHPGRGNPFDADGALLECLRERDGEVLWKGVLSRSPKGAWFPNGGPQRGVPLVRGDRLWVLTNFSEALCLDIGPLRRGAGDPRPLWKVDLMADLGVTPTFPGMGFGVVGSMATFGDGRLYVTTGNAPWVPSTKKKANLQAPALVCLDAETGAVLGLEASGITARAFEPNWASPVTVTLPAGRLVVFGGGDGVLYGFDAIPDPATRTLKERWRIDCRRTPEDKVGFVATPVVHEARIYAATGEPESSGRGRLCCVDAASGRLLWENLDVDLTITSVVVSDGRVFSADLTGIVRCLDAGSGKQLWMHDTLGRTAACPLLVDDRLFIATGDDELIVYDAKAPPGTIRPLHKLPLFGELLAAPVYARGALYLAGRGRFFAIRGSDAGPAAVDAGPKGRASDALFVPTPKDIVEKMLEMAALRKDDLLYDLGSGDGRILIAAGARGCRAVGVEIDRDLVEQSRKAIEIAGLVERARIEHEDLLKVDFSAATVVTLYVGTRLNGLLVPKLKALQPGSRVVSHDFEVPGLPCELDVTVVSNGDNRSHRLFLYRIAGPK